MEAACHLLVGSGHEAGGCGTPGNSRARLTHWWTGLGSGMVVRDGFLYLALACWWVRPVPDTVGCWVQGVLNLVLACLWAGPGHSQSQERIWPIDGLTGFTGCRAAVVLRLVSIHWWVKLILRIE